VHAQDILRYHRTMRSFHIWAAALVGTSGWVIAAGCESDETTPTGATSTNVSNVTSTTTSTATTTAQGGNPGTGGGMGQGGGQGGGPDGPCGDVCLNGGEPNQGCLNCVTNNCGAEFTACAMDMGAGGGGVGGGGVGGTGGGGPCLSCAEVATGGDPNNICAASAALLDALNLCVCGDATQPGMCG
jgi:hypothetical protein